MSDDLVEVRPRFANPAEEPHAPEAPSSLDYITDWAGKYKYYIMIVVVILILGSVFAHWWLKKAEPERPARNNPTLPPAPPASPPPEDQAPEPTTLPTPSKEEEIEALKAILTETRAEPVVDPRSLLMEDEPKSDESTQ